MVLVAAFVLHAQVVPKQFMLRDVQSTATPVKQWFFPAASADRALRIDHEQIRWPEQTQENSVILPNGFVGADVSADGRYFALLSTVAHGGSAARQRFQLELYSVATGLRLALQLDQFRGEALPMVAIASDGRVVIGRAPTGTLWFYDAAGNLTSEATLFSGAEYDLERVLRMAISADSERLAVAATKRSASPTGADVENHSGEPHVFLFGLRGEELWSRPLPGTGTNLVAIAPNGQYIVADGYEADVFGNVKKVTHLLDGTGRKIADHDMLTRHVVFSADARVVVLAGKQRVKSVRTADGASLWQSTIPRRRGMVAGLSAADGGRLSAVVVAKNRFTGGGFLFVEPEVDIYDQRGALVQRLALVDETFVTPAVMLSPDGRLLRIGLLDGYRTYEVAP